MREESQSKILRFPLAYRIEHWIFMLAFTTLGITGLAQKFASAGISKAIIRLLGGIEITRLIHHTTAIIMMIEVVYHLGAVIYRLYVKRYRPSMLPTKADVTNGWQALLYNLGLRKNPAQQGRYTFEEKLEYWAVVWGTIIMVFTGFMMWNPIATARFLPGQAIPAAKFAHGAEAVLAVLAIILWHLYGVIIKRFNPSMFTGKLPAEEMMDEHPLELADIKAGVAARSLDPKKVARRQRLFFPIYGVLAVLMLFGIFKFATLETTAVAAYPSAEAVTVYYPQTPTPLPTLPPTPTPAPTQPGGGPKTWEGGIASIFQNACADCHGPDLQKNDLNLASYSSAVTGGQTGPGIVPGSPDKSEIVIMQSTGNHPGQLTDQQLQEIVDWIKAGAPEK